MREVVLMARSRLRQRCLVLAFEQDILWPPRAAREAVAVMPNATYAEIAGAAHGGPLTHAEPVSRAVVSFFAAE